MSLDLLSMDGEFDYSLIDSKGNGIKNGSIIMDPTLLDEQERHVKSPTFISVNSDTIPRIRSRMSLSRDNSSQQITYSWKNINVKTGTDKNETSKWNFQFGKKKVPKQILYNVSGTLYPGELVAVLGSSGTGKSTLMDVLTFRNSHSLKVTGERCINGIPVGSNTITSISAYVQQMDLFIGILTVREHLSFHAQVRMHKHIPYEHRMEIVDEIIREFGLTKCAETQIGTKWTKGISGGEMKRLSIASEVLTDPMFMCCDEPTSGLDSNTAQQVISVLKNLTSKQKTVICTVHQPSSQLFALFDKVLLMAEGRVAFLGTATDAIEFFYEVGYPCPAMYNPADFLVDTLAIKNGNENKCKENVNKICDAFEEHQTTTNYTNGKSVEDLIFMNSNNPETQSRYKASAMKQFQAVFKRSCISFARDPMVFKMRMAQTIFLGLFTGIIYYQLNLGESEGIQNLSGAMFMILCSLTYQHMLASLDNFCSEVPVFLREHFNGMYRTDIYFLCKILVEIPFYIILPLLFAGTCYYMIGFDPNITSFIKTLLVMILVTTTCSGLGCFMSCISKDISVALILTPAVIFPFFLFGGFLIRPGSGPIFLVWLEYLSWYFYGYEALAIVQLENIKGIECTFPLTVCPHTGQEVLLALNFKKENFVRDIVALAISAVVSQILAYLSLLARAIRK